MNIKTIEEIMKEIHKKYNEDPYGWKVLSGIDNKGFIDLYFIHKNKAWRLKIWQLDPFRNVGYGISLENFGEIKKLKNYPLYGFRDLSKKEAIEILTLPPKEAIKRLMNIKPVPIDELNKPIIVEGPITFSNKPLSFLSEEQRNLDQKLSSELEKLLLKKYIDRIKIYG
jgi:hypothetical protein